MRVLAARPRDAEAQLAFSALADLLDDVGGAALASLPGPQLRALEVALLRTEPLAGDPPEPRAIGVGFLNALRALAAEEPLLVAIDDVQWLDAPSAEAVAFVARRLRHDSARFLLAKRSRAGSSLERALGPVGLERLDVGPMSIGATRRILEERLGLTLPRRLLRRVFDAAGGNPLFALELGRALAERRSQPDDEELPVPDLLEDLLGTRVVQLAPPLRRLLLAVALDADLRLPQLASICDAGVIDDAVDAGVVLVDGERVRASHPLLAAAARRHSGVRERRALHRELANAVADDELRARHLALATSRPDPVLATTISATAANALARGVADEAVELAEHALRLTPSGAPARGDRMLTLAEYLVAAGERRRASDLLRPEVAALAPGVLRARAYLLLSGADAANTDEVADLLDRALAESEGDQAVRATALAHKAFFTAVELVDRVAESETGALEALAAAREAGPELERLALHALAWTRILRGRAVDDLGARFDEVSPGAYHLDRSLDRVAGVRMMWRGEIDAARRLLARMLLRADERGEAWADAVIRVHACEVELRAGDLHAASQLLDEWARAGERDQPILTVNARCRALLAAGRGDPDDAERWAAAAIAGAGATATRWDVLEAQRARGVAALLAGEPERAAADLRAVWDHARRAGVADPGAFPVAPDLVEALVELGERDEAHEVNARLQEPAERQEHPWGLASAQRCRALVRLTASAYDADAAAELSDSARHYGELGLRFDRARSLLALGRAARRCKKWGAARGALEQAAAAFDEMGAPGWAVRARSDLSRVGARRPTEAGTLTPTELRVAELAADGLSNKEIARALFVSVHTIEVHLSHAYAKLRIRSRGQLAARLAKA